MQSGEIIYEQGGYKIQFYKNSFGLMSFGNERLTGKAYHFKLIKDGVDFKFYATAIKWPSPSLPDFDKMKQTVIEVLKTFIV